MYKKQVLLSALFAFIFLLSGLTFGMVKLTDTGAPASSGGGYSAEPTNQTHPIVTRPDKPTSSLPVMSKLKHTVNRFRSTHQIAKESASTQK